MTHKVETANSTTIEARIEETKKQSTVGERTYVVIRGATQLDRETHGLKGGDANKAVERKGIVANIEKGVQDRKFSSVRFYYGPEGHYKQTAEVAAEQLKSRSLTVVTQELTELRKVLKPLKDDLNVAAKENAEKQLFETTGEQIARIQGVITSVAKEGDDNTLRVLVTDGALILNFLRELQKTDRALQVIAEGKSLRPHNDDVYVLARDASGKDVFVDRFGHVSKPKAPKAESAGVNLVEQQPAELRAKL